MRETEARKSTRPPKQNWGIGSGVRSQAEKMRLRGRKRGKENSEVGEEVRDCQRMKASVIVRRDRIHKRNSKRNRYITLPNARDYKRSEVFFPVIPHTTLTVSRSSLVMSWTAVLAIFAALDGTIPCHPSSPHWPSNIASGQQPRYLREARETSL